MKFYFNTRGRSTIHENDPEVSSLVIVILNSDQCSQTIDREKQRNLSGNQHKTSTPHKNAPGWNEYLASSSEAAVKADRSEDATPEDMQKETTEHIRARHHADEDDATNRGTQPGPEFQKEDVKGPLGSAKGDVADRGNRSSGVSGDKA